MQKILIVDDKPQNIKVMANILRQLGVSIEYALSGQEAINHVLHGDYDLILMDVMMPHMSGYDTARVIREEMDLTDIPIIFVTALDESEGIRRAFEVGGVDYITKPLKDYEVLARVKTHLKMKANSDLLRKDNEILEREVQRRTVELERTQEAIIVSLANLMERRDNETGSHIIRTMEYMNVLVEALLKHKKYKDTFTEEEAELLSKSAVLHDIGKVGISDAILLKPGRLTKEEFETMKMHTLFGYETLKTTIDMIGENCFLKNACNIAYCHHERWNGQGYPKGLHGDDIPISAQMMAIVDVYDALTSKRVYKDAVSHDEAVEIILSERRRHFAPDMVDVFIEVQDRFWRIAYQHADSQEEQEAIGLHQ